MTDINTSSLNQAVLETIWRQWKDLGMQIHADRETGSVIDPEALLLITLYYTDQEKRLIDIVFSLAENGSHLLSVQRVKNLVDRFPVRVKSGLAGFAHTAYSKGNDFRWKGLAGTGTEITGRKKALWKNYPQKWHPSALTARLRLVVGVNLTADLLGFLISSQGQLATVRRLSEATGYSSHSARRTADQLVGAGILTRTHDQPVLYRIDYEEWFSLLNIRQESLSWRFWYPMFGFIASIIDLADRQERENQSPYLLSSSLRELTEACSKFFLLNGLHLPDPGRYPGEEYLAAIPETLQKLEVWLKEDGR